MRAAMPRPRLRDESAPPTGKLCQWFACSRPSLLPPPPAQPKQGRHGGQPHERGRPNTPLTRSSAGAGARRGIGGWGGAEWEWTGGQSRKTRGVARMAVSPQKLGSGRSSKEMCVRNDMLECGSTTSPQHHISQRTLRWAGRPRTAEEKSKGPAGVGAGSRACAKVGNSNRGRSRLGDDAGDDPRSHGAGVFGAHSVQSGAP